MLAKIYIVIKSIVVRLYVNGLKNELLFLGLKVKKYIKLNIGV